MITKLQFILLLLATISLSSCTKNVAPADPPFLKRHVGEECVVRFRGDALGAGATLPISPTTDSINGADVNQVGKLIAIEGEGIVLEEATPLKRTYWIPYQVILSVRFKDKK